MSTVKRLVCLANSRKLSGRCIAGRVVVDGKGREWVRPISDRENEEVSEHERQYSDGSDPRVLDIIDIPLLEPRPYKHQQENWLLDPNAYWVKQGHLAWEKLHGLIDTPDRLWLNESSTRNGENDKIEVNAISRLKSSLYLIHIDKLTISVFAPGEEFGDTKRRVQAKFEYNGEPYKLWVTDPHYEREYLRMSDGDYALGESFVTISINEKPFKGGYYKFVAAIMEKAGS